MGLVEDYGVKVNIENEVPEVQRGTWRRSVCTGPGVDRRRPTLSNIEIYGGI